MTSYCIFKYHININGSGTWEKSSLFVWICRSNSCLLCKPKQAFIQPPWSFSASVLICRLIMFVTKPMKNFAVRSYQPPVLAAPPALARSAACNGAWWPQVYSLEARRSLNVYFLTISVWIKDRDRRSSIQQQADDGWWSMWYIVPYIGLGGLSRITWVLCGLWAQAGTP